MKRVTCLVQIGGPGQLKSCEKRCDLECAVFLMEEVYFELRNRGRVDSKLMSRVGKFVGANREPEGQK
jgi:hypothetical protein